MARDTFTNQSGMSYLEQSLSGDEDPGLQMQKTYMTSPSQNYNVPPGIRNLQQWGSLVIPSGKNQGKSFSQVFEMDKNYVYQIRNRRAVSSWLRSFQNYMIAREKYEMKNQAPVPPVTANYVTSTALPKGKALPKAAPKLEKTEDWQVISDVEIMKKEKNKRPNEPSTMANSSMMPTDPNPERVRMLQTQIAVLQRELARETQVPTDEGEEPPLN